MNKSSWTPLKVASVVNPTEVDLDRVLSLARQNLGRPVELPFGTGKGYLLTAITPPDPSGMNRVSYVEWTLIDVENSHLPPLWSHRTTDLAVLLGMIHLEISKSSSAGIPAHPAVGATMMTTQEMPPGGFMQQVSSSAGLPIQSLQPMQPMQAQQMPLNGGGMPDTGNAASGTYATFGVNLSGELEDIDLFGVLQSVSICKMTGRLEIVEGMRQIELFFEEGTPVHATKEDALLVEGASAHKGYDVLLESLLWKRGKFAFASKILAKEKTVTKRMDALLVEAAALRDQRQELEKRGFDDDAPIYKVNPSMSEQEFETLVRAGGVPADLNIQKTIYSQMKPGESMHDFLVRMPMPMGMWLPAVFNMTMQNVIAPKGKTGQPVFQSTGAIDFSIIDNAFLEILRPETDMLSYPLFLMFVQREHKRSARTRTGYSVVIFDVKQNGLLPAGKHLRRVVKAFNLVKGELDLVGHFQTLEFGFVLPFSNGEKALGLCRNLVKTLADLPPEEEEGELTAEPKEPEAPLKLSFGVVSVPEDSTDLTKAILLAQSNRLNKAQGRYFEA
ncbi:MAG TPA: DUF4388 domain-containing protein [Candidatus Melainabacteria bacterium]|nr:DUF4388 domain-containing protein [Candidatus Melainabacteria bacterium]